MRRIGTFGIAGVLLATGCSMWKPYTPPPPPPPAANAAIPTAVQLLAYRQDVAQRLNGLDVPDLSVECKQGRQSASLDGWLVCQKPRQFRMGGKVLGQPEVDLGSNDQEFWFWIKRFHEPGRETYLYHCAHKDVERGLRMPVPFQPDLVLEALGMTVTGTPQTVNLKVNPTTFELIEDITLPGGQPAKKVVVFHRSTVQPPTPQIKAYLLKDVNDRTIASASIERVAFDARSGAVYPTSVTLAYPAEQLEMKLTLNSTAWKPIVVNPNLDSNRLAKLFTRPSLAGTPTFDLARGQPTPRPTANAIQRVGNR